MRFVLYFVFLIALQGGLSALIPQNLGGPNLFLLTAVALALRLHPVPSLLVAYAIGLGQDVLGHGYLGLHAAGTGWRGVAATWTARFADVYSSLARGPRAGNGPDWRVADFSSADLLATRRSGHGLEPDGRAAARGGVDFCSIPVNAPPSELDFWPLKRLERGDFLDGAGWRP